MTAAKALNPESIYFGGVTATGGARILLAAAQAGLADIPYVGPDGINDGSGETKDSFLNLAGTQAKNSFSTLAGIGDFPARPSSTSTTRRSTGSTRRATRARATPAPRSSSTPSGGPVRPTLPTTPHSARRSASQARPATIPIRRSLVTSTSTRTVTPARRSSRSTRSILPARTARATGSSRPRSTTPSSRSAVQAARPGIDDPRPRNIQGPASTSSQAKDPR